MLLLPTDDIVRLKKKECDSQIGKKKKEVPFFMVHGCSKSHATEKKATWSCFLWIARWEKKATESSKQGPASFGYGYRIQKSCL